MLIAVFGIAAPVAAQQRAAYGLDARPSNDTCLAFDRVAPGATVDVQRVFPNVPLSNAVSLTQRPGDSSYWYYTTRDGRMYRFENQPDANSVELVADLRDRVIVVSDGGLINMVFHPNFPQDPRVFVNYSTPAADGTSVADIILSYFSSSDGGVTFDPASEVVMIRQVRQTYHQGGTMGFDLDGMFLAAIGDGAPQRDPDDNTQRMTDFRGKVVRLDVDSATPYAIPADNPFVGSGGDPLEEIWAWGFRNPYAGDIDPLTGDMWLGDVGFNTSEEVDVVVRGGNFGWNIHEGTTCTGYEPGCGDPTLIDPVVEYSHAGGNCAVIGGVVYGGSTVPALQGRFVYGDYCSSKISSVEYDENGDPFEDVLIPPGSGLGNITGFGHDNDGEAYVIAGNALYQIVPAGTAEVSGAPALLSETGCFEASDPTVPMPGLVPFAMRAPLWSDDASKRRWVALPNGKTITVAQNGDFLFPTGTVLVKEFSLDGAPVETRLLVRHEDGIWAGYSYEWNGGDAQLLPAGKRKTLPSGKVWNYPSRGECLRCHTGPENISLGPQVLQLNGDFVYPDTNRIANQLHTLDHIGLLGSSLPAPVTELPALAQLGELNHSPARRARSYFQSNCSGCHQGEGITQVDMDLRFSVPTVDAKICNTAVQFGNLGIPGAQRLIPGDPAHSILVQRPGSTDPLVRMPPLGTEVVDAAAIAVLNEWINDPSTCTPQTDVDGDGVPANQDNCPNVANPSQFDLDEDGIGDRCDADHSGDGDGDGLIDGEEIVLGTNPLVADSDGDGALDGQEINSGSDPLDPTSTPANMIDPDLILHYRFDADPALGPVPDASGNGHVATCQAGVDCPRFEPSDGQAAGSVDFTGAGNVLLVQGEQDFDFTSGFTAAMWMKASSMSKRWANLIGKGDTSWSLDRYEVTDRLAFTTFAGGYSSLVGATPVLDGQWHHVAIVYDGAQKRLYVDGVVDAQGSYTQALSLNDVPVQIGMNGEYPAGEADGLIDDVRVYKRALSQGEIAGLLGTPPSGTITSPLATDRFRGGQTIAFSGSASDAEDGPLGASAFGWQVVLHRDGVQIPVSTQAGVASGSFTVPTDGAGFLGNVRYEVRLTVVDSDGASDVDSVFIEPDRAQIDFASTPTGRSLTLDGVAQTTPFSVQAGIGFQHVIAAPDAGAGSQLFTFTGWSDGGARSHTITVPAAGAAYTASYDVTVLDPTADEDGDGLLNGFELDHGFDPFVAGEQGLDGDGDTLTNLEEQAAGTDPTRADTDGDGYTDSEEIAAGTDPLDPGSAPTPPTDPDLILHYRFDSDPSPSGVVPDVSGQGHDGACTPGGGCPAFQPSDGQAPGSVDFTGPGNVIVVSNESDFDFTSGFTAAMWMKASSMSKRWANLIGKGDTSWSLDRYEVTDRLAFTTFAGGYNSLVGTKPVLDGQWHHVAIVYDGAQKRLYIDGVVDVQSNYTASLSRNNVPVQIGMNGEYAAGEADGLIDDVRVYKRALSAGEIAALLGTPPTATIQSPASSLRFQGGQTVAFSGAGSDVEDGALPASALVWQVVLHRDGVQIPVSTQVGVASGSFAVPTDGAGFLGDVRYEVRLTVTDSDGASGASSVFIEPDRVQIDFGSVPTGLPLTVDGVLQSAPFSLQAGIGFQHVIAAPDSGAGAELFTFASWSDGGAQSHPITISAAGGSFVASYDVTVLDPTADEDGDGLLNGFELDHGFDPFVAGEQGLDGDGDALTNLEEQAAGTDPNLADTDGDGFSDGEEIAAGTDPLDPASSPAPPTDPDLILHYRFDSDPSQTGAVSDASGQGHDGTCSVGSTCPGFAAADGQPAGSLDLTGAGNYIRVTGESDFDFTSGFTAALWMKTDTFGGARWANLIGKGDTSWSLDRYEVTNQLAFTTFTGGYSSLVGSTPVADGQWHHVAIVYDGAQKRLYVDGVLDAQVNFTQSISTNDVPVQIGLNGEYAPGQYDGLVDEVRIYKRALSAGEVGDLVAGGAP